MILAAKKITPGSLNGFVLSDHMTFIGPVVFQEPVDVEALNRAGFGVVCRDRHYTVDSQEYDAVIYASGIPGHFVARLTPIPRVSLWAKILRFFGKPS